MSYGYRNYRGFSLDPIWIIIIVNLLVYIGGLVLGRGFVLSLLGFRPLSLTEQPWTIITAVFTHLDFFHLTFNMLTFYFFGSFLISLLGEGKFLLIYFGAGILGNIFFLLLASPFSIAIGASGAVFGLGGALAVLRPSQKVLVFPIPAPIPLWIAVVGGFMLVAFAANVAWQAHLGGVILGAIAGYYYKRRGF